MQDLQPAWRAGLVTVLGTGPSPVDHLQDLHRRARLRLLRMHFDSGVGHLGGNLSSLDLMLTLHHRVMEPDDRFLLSKGHAAGALYVTLWSLGRISDAELATFHQDGTRLAAHPVAGGLPDVPFGVGSLGHGLGLAAGLGMARKLGGRPGRVFCLMSDGEWNEGSTWESLMFIAQRDLRQVIAVVDLNHLQGFGATPDVVVPLGGLAARIESCGVEVRQVDGHVPDEIERALRLPARGRPLALLARTTKGRGVSFMENRLDWHYLPMTPAQYQAAVDEVTRG